MEYLACTDLAILNRGNEPTFVTRVREQVIDISLASRNIRKSVKEWKVSQETSLSDHRIIRFKILADQKTTKEYRNPISTDWNRYKIELAERMEPINNNIMTTDELETSVIKLQTSLLTSYEIACPSWEKWSRVRTLHFRILTWWPNFEKVLGEHGIDGKKIKIKKLTKKPWRCIAKLLGGKIEARGELSVVE
jgi:hypothetical protein